MSEIRNRILGLASRFGPRRVEIASLGGPVWIRPATIRDVSALGDMTTKAGQISANARLIITCLLNEDGTPILSDADMDMVMAWPATVFNAVTEEVQAVSSLTGTEVEDARKNSPTTP
jgi:hypothetical protein